MTEEKMSATMSLVSCNEMVHVWGCFLSRGEGSLKTLPKNTDMNEEWHQNILQEELLPTIQEQCANKQWVSQHDGAPCHKVKMTTKWLGELNRHFESVASPDLNPIENLWPTFKKRMDKQNPRGYDQLQALIR